MRKRNLRRFALAILSASMIVNGVGAQTVALAYASDNIGDSTDLPESVDGQQDIENPQKKVDENNSAGDPQGYAEGQEEADKSQEDVTDVKHIGWYQDENKNWYYYNQEGVLVKGWLWTGSRWYYLDEKNTETPGIMAKDCAMDIGGSKYFFDGNGAMQTGWILRPEGWYYAAGSGAMATGWLWTGSRWYYLDGADEEYRGRMAANCERSVGGVSYFFDGNGAMQTGWVLRPEGWYYAAGSGAKATGWLWTGSRWYYLDGADEEYRGRMAANCERSVGGVSYFFDGNGAMQTGWVLRPEGWYYAAGSGAKATGWLWTGSRWYYLDPANETHVGLMAANCEKSIGNNTYCFDANGAMITGWYKKDTGWYYIDPSGLMASGWRRVGGVWYYLDPNDGNRMADCGWKEINGAKYFLNGNGAMAENWLLLGSDWYYLGKDGAMKTGWQFVGNFWYYMYKASDPNGGSEGVMAKNTTIEGYVLSGSGAMLTATDLAARNILDQVGWNLRAAYNWSAGLRYYRMTAEATPGCEWFANYGFQNRKGNCYVMAATFYYMARQLGYDVHQVAGYVPRRGGGVTPHSWCEIVIGGTTYVFDPNFTNETGRNGYQITYGTSGTWRYSNYHRMN